MTDRDETNLDKSEADESESEPHVFRDADGRARGVMLVPDPDPPSSPRPGQPLRQTFWSPFYFDFYPGTQRRFEGRLPELASLIVAELASVGSRFCATRLTVFFEGERVCVAAGINPKEGYVCLDVELEECLEFEQLGTLNGVPVGIHVTPTKN